ncbi:proline--tRNA ligase [Buchnera aphidicola]|nr:proline--tRNA ligase [Buchnera aphidicola]
MRTSQYLLSTLKNHPKNAEIISHQLMLRAGLIRQLSSGIYIWLPTGVKVLNKLKNIINQEMQKIGGMEINLPNIHPIKIWNTSNRINNYGNELFTIIDRKKNNWILGPTHEEVATELAKLEIQSYKQLPIIMYQMKTKFRDEIRPQFGIVRTKEFLMKDAYSFHVTTTCLSKTYELIKYAYNNIFSKIQLKFNIVAADSGAIGGNISHEFKACKNIQNNKNSKNKSIQTCSNIFKIYFLKYYSINDSTKTIYFAYMIKINKNIDLIKIQNDININTKINLASKEEIQQFFKKKKEINLEIIRKNIPVIIHKNIIIQENFSIELSQLTICLINNYWFQYLPNPIKYSDNLLIEINDFFKKKNKQKNYYQTELEIAHIFQIGIKYSKYFNLKVKNNKGKNTFLKMGCYGIGVTRTIAAVIEQNYDEKGIIWPLKIAPFEVTIIPINLHKCVLVKKYTQLLYSELLKNNIDVLLNDLEENPGVIFSNMDLIGIPYQIIVSPKNIQKNKIEIKYRYDNKKIILNISECIKFIKNEMNKNI